MLYNCCFFLRSPNPFCYSWVHFHHGCHQSVGIRQSLAYSPSWEKAAEGLPGPAITLAVPPGSTSFLPALDVASCLQDQPWCAVGDSGPPSSLWTCLMPVGPPADPCCQHPAHSALLAWAPQDCARLGRALPCCSAAACGPKLTFADQPADTW